LGSKRARLHTVQPAKLRTVGPHTPFTFACTRAWNPAITVNDVLEAATVKAVILCLRFHETNAPPDAGAASRVAVSPRRPSALDAVNSARHGDAVGLLEGFIAR